MVLRIADAKRKPISVYNQDRDRNPTVKQFAYVYREQL
jgi:hypothetical protein